MCSGEISKLEIQWSPIHENKFITWGPDVRMYEVSSTISESPKNNDVPKGITLSSSTVANLLATSTNHRYVKCVDIYPKPDSEIMLAIGHANGKVTFCTFGLANINNTLAGLELGPSSRFARQCNSISWNPVNYNLLACGLDKHRSDQCVQIWDVEKSPLINADLSAARPFFEYGMGETAHSLAWFNTSPHVLAVSCNNKQIRCVDIRDASRSTNTVQTRAVYGIDIAVYNNNHIVSYNDNSIVLWDSRHLEKPVVTLTQSKSIIKVQWCPTRHNLLGSLQKDTMAISLHDMQQSMEEAEPSALERTVHPGQGNIHLASFSWHPVHENRLLAISQTGILNDYWVFERMTLNWSTTSNIVWTYGQNNLKFISDKDLVYSSFEDVAIAIKMRAFSQYGIKDFAENAKLVDDPVIKNVWSWLDLNRRVTKAGLVPTTPDVPFPGIKTVLGVDSTATTLKSELKHVQWVDIQGTVKTYRSLARDHALYLCDWGFDRTNGSHISAVLRKLENENSYTRAASIAIFNLRMRDAIETLNKGASQQPHLSMIAMALSGYSPDKYSMWRELCSKTREKLTDPYLRAAFAFLTSDSDSHDTVLNEVGIPLEDRIAFACIFLSDQKLIEYINLITDKLLDQGNLSAIFLIGSSPELVPLLQRYLDNTGDIQTASILVLKTIPSEIVHEHPAMMNWINSYREILDQWRMWHIRAKFDIALKAVKPPPQNVFLSCNYCGKNICPTAEEREKDSEKEIKVQRMKDQGIENGSNSLKFTACPNCQSPLPRCALCLAHLGTASAKIPTRKTSSKQLPTNSAYMVNGQSVNNFSYWFSWCPTCNHGGHSNHITDWFRNHLECPVADCVCRCYSLDSTSRYCSL
ncbi:GATOR complex protein MIOS isoform X2 [Adelges cooleyi]|uniref:GATOR complex protein MIOS isoform X2 n=1 Tax=Adelges cooleyi TaxID=133065 RepID=UPI00217FCE70|nr:GATOR complex protein MIOS isoform X2 [Adelges cooleyi]